MPPDPRFGYGTITRHSTSFHRNLALFRDLQGGLVSSYTSGSLRRSYTRPLGSHRLLLPVLVLEGTRPSVLARPSELERLDPFRSSHSVLYRLDPFEVFALSTLLSGSL